MLTCATILLVLASFTGSARATSTMTIISNTTLTQNFAGQIVIGANNVTLDCAGFSVIGPGASPSAGIASGGVQLDGRTGVTIRNCTVTGFQAGIFLSSGSSGNTLNGNRANGNFVGFFLGFPILSGANTNTFTGNTANNNLRSGFELTSSSSANTLTANTANGNGVFGFVVSSTSNTNTLNGNTANDEPFGFAIFDSSGNTLAQNAANNDLTGAAFFVAGSTASSVRNNMATNSNVGIQVSSSSGTIVANNVAKGNFFGFAFTQTNTIANSVVNNLANSNVKYGFFITSDVSGNSFTQNSACHNGIFDGFQAIPGSNSFNGNHFCTSSGIP